jgi:ElaA protein
MLDVNVKSFEELTPQELYSVLQLRSEIFVVEQNCVYQDMDDKDQKALHLLGMKNGNLVAYTRIFKPGDYFEFASIGRVVVSQNQRQHKYGYDIMNASIETVKEYLNTTEIKIGAQCYLKKFYNNLGFKEVGEGYLEDGIPHIHMIRTP